MRNEFHTNCDCGDENDFENETDIDIEEFSAATEAEEEQVFRDNVLQVLSCAIDDFLMFATFDDLLELVDEHRK